MENKTYTRGNVIIYEDIKVGDIHYEYGYGVCIKSTVISAPKYNKDLEGYEWVNERDDGEIINYFVNPKYSHYGPNLYDYKAYSTKIYI